MRRGTVVVRPLCRIAAWFLAVAIFVLHIVPPTHRPVTSAAHNVEHLVIFLGLGLVFGLGYYLRTRLLALALPAFCLAVEAVQQWVPGRHARLSDFLVNTVSAVVGLGVAFVLIRTVLPRAWFSRGP